MLFSQLVLLRDEENNSNHAHKTKDLGTSISLGFFSNVFSLAMKWLCCHERGITFLPLSSASVLLFAGTNILKVREKKNAFKLEREIKHAARGISAT